MWLGGHSFYQTFSGAPRNVLKVFSIFANHTEVWASALRLDIYSYTIYSIIRIFFGDENVLSCTEAKNGFILFSREPGKIQKQQSLEEPYF